MRNQRKLSGNEWISTTGTPLGLVVQIGKLVMFPTKKSCHMGVPNQENPS